MITRKKKRIIGFWILTVLLLLGSGGYITATTRAEAASPLIISEFLAGNDSGPMDEQGDHSDWIEIYNPTNRPVNLSGWYLSDDPARPEKWPLPPVTLASHDYLVIFASGKENIVGDPGTELHANFKLSKSDRFLLLYNVFQGRSMDVVSLGGLGYFRDVSYGRHQEAWGYFTSPTPGQPNNTAFISPEDIPTVITFKQDSEIDDVPGMTVLRETALDASAAQSPLRISEIMYHPVGGDDYEFIELTNIGATPLDLSGAYFEGIEMTFKYGFPPLAPGDYIVLAYNETAFAERYPTVSIADTYDGSLANRGERITLRDYNQNVLASVKYDDENGWPLSADGAGDSLTLVSPEDPSVPYSWRASAQMNGSPGTGSEIPSRWLAKVGL
jgi:hypothetical protein